MTGNQINVVVSRDRRQCVAPFKIVPSHLALRLRALPYGRQAAQPTAPDWPSRRVEDHTSGRQVPGNPRWRCQAAPYFSQGISPGSSLLPCHISCGAFAPALPCPALTLPQLPGTFAPGPALPPVCCRTLAPGDLSPSTLRTTIACTSRQAACRVVRALV